MRSIDYYNLSLNGSSLTSFLHTFVQLYAFLYFILNAFFLNKKKCLFTYLESRATETEGGREIFHLLVHFSTAHNHQGWARPKPKPGTPSRPLYGWQEFGLEVEVPGLDSTLIWVVHIPSSGLTYCTTMPAPPNTFLVKTYLFFFSTHTRTHLMSNS